jgi:hypothetical protein
MPKFVILDSTVTINGVDLTDRVAQVEVQMNADDVDVSTMGAGVHQHLAGLRSDQFIVTFLSDFDAAKVDATLAPLQSTASATPEFPVKIRPRAIAVSTINPSFESTKCILLTYSPLAGAIGARSETQVTFASNALITRQTT